jgi:hypothetical protein
MNGNLIGAVNLPTLASAAGVWDLEEVKLAQQQDIWPPLLTPDLYWEYVSLLLSGETATTNGAQNNTFLDSSTNNFTLNRNGNATQGSFSPYGSNWSGYFDGGSNRLTTSTSSQFNLSGIDFTIDFFLYAYAYPTSEQNRIITIGPNDVQSSFTIGINPNGSIDVGVPYSTGGLIVGTANALPLRTWTHVAFTLSSNTGSLYINGTRVGTSSGWNISSSNNNYFYVGYDTTATVSAKYTGFVSNVRFVAGTALYSGATITVPTTPLTAVTGTRYLSLQNNRAVDNSVNNFSIGTTGTVSFTKFSPFNLTYQTSFSYGAYFDGTGDYLSVPYNSAFNLTGDFTIEFWMNPTNLPSTTGTAPQSYARIFSFGTYNAANSLGLEINSNDTGNLRRLVSWYNGTATSLTNNNAIDVGTWYHVAVVRSGTTITCYLNGTSTGTITGASAAVNTSQSFYIASLQGFESDTSACFAGNISNFRVVKGTAVYTSNFTPPTTQLTAITNTSLLTCQSPTFIDNSTNNFTITVNGNTIPTTFSPFTNTYTSLPYSAAILGGSGYFDGTGDYVNIASQTQLNLGTSNFTIELWFYDDGSSLSYPTMLGNVTGWTSGSFSIRYNNTGHANKVGVYLNPSDPLISSTNTFASKCWHHVALTRSGNTYTLYVDGTNQGSATQAGSFNLGFGGTNIGWSAWDGAQGYYKGYVTDVRVVSGTVLYNSTFVPPNSPLTAISNTQLLCNFTNGGIIDSSTINDSETVGNAQVNTTTKKYGSGSYYFDGTGDYLNVISIGVIGTTDFTCEGWFYHTSAGQAAIWWDTATSGYASSNFSIRTDYIDSSRSIYCNVGGVSTTFSYTNAVVFLNNWVHVALVRSGNTLKLYLNGNAASGTGTLNTTSVDLTNFKVAGAPSPASGYSNFTGYISDFRFTRIARYTANFTPPATSLPRF